MKAGNATGYFSGPGKSLEVLKACSDPTTAVSARSNEYESFPRLRGKVPKADGWLFALCASHFFACAKKRFSTAEWLVK